MSLQQTHITTERLTITPLHIIDAEFMYELLTSQGWLQFIGNRNISNVQDAERYIESLLGSQYAMCWAVRLQNKQTPIGILTFLKRDELEYHDFGFAFLPHYQGCGYAFEASTAVTHQLLQSGEYSTLLAITVMQNNRSVALLEKLGFTFLKENKKGNEILWVYKLQNRNKAAGSIS